MSIVFHPISGVCMPAEVTPCKVRTCLLVCQLSIRVNGKSADPFSVRNEIVQTLQTMKLQRP